MPDLFSVAGSLNTHHARRPVNVWCYGCDGSNPEKGLTEAFIEFYSLAAVEPSPPKLLLSKLSKFSNYKSER